MAVKKPKNAEDVVVEVANPVETVDEVINSAVDAVDAVEVETVDEVKTKDEIEVDPEATSKSVRKPGNVRIKMREDHKCTIAMVRYDFKKGECYHVPENVKRILDEHGLLAPLN